MMFLGMFSNIQSILKRSSSDQQAEKSAIYVRNKVVYGKSGKPGTSDLQDALKRYRLKTRRVSFEE